MAKNLPKVLIIEDEALIRLSLAEALKDEGLEVWEAEDADKALELLAAMSEIDVIVTDINMPGDMDGLDLVLKVKAELPAIPVIVASGRPIAHKLPQGVMFLMKPYRLEYIANLIKELLSNSHQTSD